MHSLHLKTISVLLDCSALAIRYSLPSSAFFGLSLGVSVLGFIIIISPTRQRVHQAFNQLLQLIQFFIIVPLPIICTSSGIRLVVLRGFTFG